MTRTVDLPAIGKSVTLGVYVAAIRSAKANPDTTFKHGLTAWWPCTGREIMQQFCAGMHDRINQRVPYRLRGIES